ncbi:MAG: hypothetical protein M3P08_16675 [Thermoproteota archaeon]|nr:hypothetical protein [Thermoproteota archaeon]
MASNESTGGDHSQNGKSETSKDLLELKSLRVQKDKIDEAYRQIFPKVDPFFIHDLILRMQEDP